MLVYEAEERQHHLMTMSCRMDVIAKMLDVYSEALAWSPAIALAVVETGGRSVDRVWQPVCMGHMYRHASMGHRDLILAHQKQWDPDIETMVAVHWARFVRTNAARSSGTWGSD